ncbi:MAG: amino acid permease [Planctomycetes bacterium]|nr:amino acid permease [Planctomycetota bacterium]
MTPSGSVPAPAKNGVRNAARVIIVGSVMFTFISYWRTAAVVLCDLGSTAYYIGGIVEQAIGAAAPWFILGVMVFSYAVRSVYIESCSLFIRGGVYRVVREALGRFSAKLAVSALIFDYLLTGPISGVSAGHYLIGLVLDTVQIINKDWAMTDLALRATIKNWGAVTVALGITLYFFRLNLRGIHESSDRALKIMAATTIMVVVMLVWCGITLATQGVATYDGKADSPKNQLPFKPDLSPRSEAESPIDPFTGKPKEQPDPLGNLADSMSDSLRPPSNVNWLSIFGVLGVLIAFGHSILAMSGEETLAQVYREVESPKLKNFRKAAFIVFIYSLVFTAGISFLAVLLIPEHLRLTEYADNLISGLAMNVVGPELLKLALNAFVVVVGFLILAGAVNTAIIGSNGVLNRVAEDGVMPDWFLRPHARYGTTYRVLVLIVGLQLAIILVSQGDVLLLGEAYAFGVVWSFVFQALSMVVLRFKDTRRREYKVPLNFKFGSVEVPFGLLLVLLVLLSAALLNLFTKPVATLFGGIFTATFFSIFFISEIVHDRRLKGKKHKHLEQFNQQSEELIDVKSLGLGKPYRKLVAIRSTQNLVMLEKALADTDPKITDVVVMTAKAVPQGDDPYDKDFLDPYEQDLMTAVVQKAESAGKEVKPLIVPTNNPLYALLRTAMDLQVHELVVGASNKYSADEQFEQIAFYWINLHGGTATPLTVRIIGKDRDVHLDLGGGNRIPRLGESRARSVAELRAAGVGVDRVLLISESRPDDIDLFQACLTMLDPEVILGLVIPKEKSPDASGSFHMVQEQSRQVGRKVEVFSVDGDRGAEIVRLAKEKEFDLIIVPLGENTPSGDKMPLAAWMSHVVQHAHCRVVLASAPSVPKEAAPD